MEEVTIREFAPADLDAAVEIALAAWQPIYSFYRQQMGDDLFATACPNWQEEKARQIRRACDPQSGAIVSVAVHAGRVIGFVTFYAHASSHIGEIGNNAVHPDFQGRGVGPRMYDHAFVRLRALGMRYVRVRTGGDPAHAPARRAYQKAGFEIALPDVLYYRKL